MALFYFIRHGETEWNAEGRFCGRTDVPLSDAGRRQARLLALRAKSILIDGLYSSPLRRALETARIIGEVMGREPVVDERLTELNYGTWEGLTLEEIERTGPAIYQAWKRDPGSLAPPEGESGAQLVERVMPFLRDVALSHPAGNVMVVCHKTVCRLLACHFLGVPLSEYRQAVHMDNAALNTFEFQDGIWRVVALNDTSHLTSPREIPC
ncbi:MAG: histidine phosphatase family protein, partial [Terriglobia bacterium]